MALSVEEKSSNRYRLQNKLKATPVSRCRLHCCSNIQQAAGSLQEPAVRFPSRRGLIHYG
jgi:hypothetical protein